MGRKITMTGKNARYTEHRAADATPEGDRDIRMEGEEAVYQEFVYGKTCQTKQDNYIANTASSTDILKAIAELNATLRQGIEEGKAEPRIEIKELVLQKQVDTEIQNVEAGGTGIKNG